MGSAWLVVLELAVVFHAFAIRLAHGFNIGPPMVSRNALAHPPSTHFQLQRQIVAGTDNNGDAVGSVVFLVAATALSIGLTSAGTVAKRLQRARPQRVVRCGSSPASALDSVSFKRTFFFPGQGAQYVGMCKDLTNSYPAAKSLFERASAILGYDLLDCCVNGPKEVLNTTAVSQPAIFVASMAALEKLKKDEGAHALSSATAAMGLSLGEYSALCFAGALSFEDGVHVTKARGEAMQAAADIAQTGMVSVVGLSAEKTKELCKMAEKMSGKKVQVANYLCDGNYTVSGEKDACAKVVELAKPTFKARMATPLAVAGAFHTEFMALAVPKLKEVLARVELRSPRVPVISNVDALPHGTPAEIRATLAKQVISPVLWEKQVRAALCKDFVEGYELGPGKVIAGIMKRIDKKAGAAIINIEA